MLRRPFNNIPKSPVVSYKYLGKRNASHIAARLRGRVARGNIVGVPRGQRWLGDGWDGTVCSSLTTCSLFLVMFEGSVTTEVVISLCTTGRVLLQRQGHTSRVPACWFQDYERGVSSPGGERGCHAPLAQAELSVSIGTKTVDVIAIGHGDGVLSPAGHVDAPSS